MSNLEVSFCRRFGGSDICVMSALSTSIEVELPFRCLSVFMSAPDIAAALMSP